MVNLYSSILYLNTRHLGLTIFYTTYKFNIKIVS
jgi:hypothetical protein